MMLPDRISSRISPQPDGCWSWGGTHNDHGYGRVWFEGRMQTTHVVVYTLTVGPVPEGMELDHTCENKGCCNPDHLEPVTHAENIRRCAYSRSRRGQEQCYRGHDLNDENTYVTKLGTRTCRPCRRINQRNSSLRKAAA